MSSEGPPLDDLGVVAYVNGPSTPGPGLGISSGMKETEGIGGVSGGLRFELEAEGISRRPSGTLEMLKGLGAFGG